MNTTDHGVYITLLSVAGLVAFNRIRSTQEPQSDRSCGSTARRSLRGNRTRPVPVDNGDYVFVLKNFSDTGELAKENVELVDGMELDSMDSHTIGFDWVDDLKAQIAQAYDLNTTEYGVLFLPNGGIWEEGGVLFADTVCIEFNEGLMGERIHTYPSIQIRVPIHGHYNPVTEQTT